MAQGATQSEAYRRSYDVDNMAPETIWSEASRLRRHPRVSARIDQILDEKERNAAVERVRTREYVLQSLFDAAENATSVSARISALALLGRTVGLFSPTAEEEPERSAEEIEAAILSRLASTAG